MLQLHNEDCLLTMSRIEDKSVNLIIADFPYFEVKGEFDFIWKDFDEFLAWVEVCAKEFKRILTDNGSLYVYGHAKKIAYKQTIFDKYFNLENHIVWEKLQCQTKIGIDEFRSYAPIKEHILFYSNDWDVSSLDKIMFNKDNFSSIKKYLKQEKEKVKSYFKFSGKEFNDYTLSLGCSTTPYKNWFCNTSFWEMATEKNYNLLQASGFFKRPYEHLRKEYEHLRKEYEEIRRPFYNIHRLEDVMKFDQQGNITGKFDHPTQKPPKLSKALIETSSRENDLVYIPFGGSGTEMEQCQLLNRRCIGSELEKKYCDIIEDRLKNAKGEVGLFKEENTIIQQGLF